MRIKIFIFQIINCEYCNNIPSQNVIRKKINGENIEKVRKKGTLKQCMLVVAFLLK
jgi:hypothetical protein